MEKNKVVKGKSINSTIRKMSEMFEGPALDVDLNKVAETLGTALGADRSYLYLVKPDCGRGIKKLESVSEWCRDGIQEGCNLLQDFGSEELSWWMEELSKGKTVFFQDISSMPIDADVEKAIFESQGVRSIMVAPLLTDIGSLRGFICIDSMLDHKDWGKRDERLMTNVSILFNRHLDRKREEIELRRALRVLDCSWRR